jgi:hypothetical protein
VRSCIVCTPRQTKRRGLWQIWERSEIHTGFWFGKRKDLLKDIGINGKMILKMDLIKNRMEGRELE